MAGNGASASINLTNSQRHVNKATYAPAKLPPGAPAAPQVLEKATFARSLGVSKSEATALHGEAGGQSAEFGKTLKLVTNIAAADWPSALNRYGQALAQTSRQALVDVGEAVLQYRQAQLSMLPQSPASSVQKSARAKNVIAPSLDPARDDIAKHTALVVGVFKYHLPVQPVGALHLERLEMTPVGVEHGELVHSVPMTPGETVNIAHKEWSVTTQTFESIVNDSFEGYS